MRLIQACCVALCLGAAVFPAYADSIDFNLSDDAFSALYSNQLTRTGRNSALVGQAGILYRKDAYGDHDVLVPGIGLLVTGNAGTPNVHAGVGARLVYINISSRNGMALAPGGRIHYSLPFYNRIGLGGHVYYAPNVVSTNDVDNYLAYGIRVDYEVLRNARVYAGYRQVKADFSGPGGYRDLDTGFHFGLHLFF